MKNSPFIIIVLMVLVSCQIDNPGKKESTNPEVAVETVERVTRQWPIHTVGTIEADKNLKLSFKIGGIIDQINVEPGDQVAKDQTLARLNTVEISSRVKQAKLAVDKANRDFERVNNLYKDSVATLEQWQNTKTALEAARAELQMARFNQKHATIKAPQPATVLRQLAQPGEMIGAGYPLIVLGITGRQYRVVAQVTDREWVQIKKGDSAVLSMDAHPGKSFNARIEQINPLPEKYTGTYRVKLIFEKTDLSMTTGMITRVKIYPGTTQQYFKIPIDALVEASGNEGYVYVLEEAKAQRRQIQIARVDRANLYVQKGLKKGEKVITSGKSFVSTGQEVKIIQKN
ncbi:MAG TPA: efflux RND transporter periplasmic adaptor subunit [Salinivirga sp.]|uniref:efflux RND transporter periplasmic adaptor subunit n=1 Tax=Salinivirga sp. TaxID=1970192 RepID=UPI002B4779AA|nr:efflux RND transporter periplasmic adaptor subunit [Salinivirga sp.]HKK60149.1 efflux RND transporter periplasmic adaptor subunit [Salinivirga sp.]